MPVSKSVKNHPTSDPSIPAEAALAHPESVSRVGRNVDKMWDSEAQGGERQWGEGEHKEKLQLLKRRQGVGRL